MKIWRCSNDACATSTPVNNLVCYNYDGKNPCVTAGKPDMIVLENSVPYLLFVGTCSTPS